MRINYFTTILFVGFLFLCGKIFAQEVEHHIDVPKASQNAALKEKIKEDIDHHIQDAHFFTFFSDSKAGEHYGFPLPVILYDLDNGFKVFSASEFHHGDVLVEKGGQHYNSLNFRIIRSRCKCGASQFHINDHQRWPAILPVEK